MKRYLKSPVVNAICIGIFTAFYTLIFWMYTGSTDFEWLKYYQGNSSFWRKWSNLLVADFHGGIASFMVAVTILVIILLLVRRRPYDEYQASILTQCLVVALILTLVAIAIFFLVILSEPIWIAGKFMLFITIHWVTVVFANLVYVLLCRWR